MRPRRWSTPTSLAAGLDALQGAEAGGQLAQLAAGFEDTAHRAESYWDALDRALQAPSQRP